MNTRTLTSVVVVFTLEYKQSTIARISQVEGINRMHSSSPAPQNYLGFVYAPRTALYRMESTGLLDDLLK